MIGCYNSSTCLGTPSLLSNCLGPFATRISRDEKRDNILIGDFERLGILNRVCLHQHRIYVREAIVKICFVKYSTLLVVIANQILTLLYIIDCELSKSPKFSETFLFVCLWL